MISYEETKMVSAAIKFLYKVRIFLRVEHSTNNYAGTIGMKWNNPQQTETLSHSMHGQGSYLMQRLGLKACPTAFNHIWSFQNLYGK